MLHTRFFVFTVNVKTPDGRASPAASKIRLSGIHRIGSVGGRRDDLP